MLAGKAFSTYDGGATWTELQSLSDLVRWPQFAMGGKTPIRAMRLLTPDVGWVLTLWNSYLFWTEDAGSTWKDITPSKQLFGTGRIFSVFFLDTRRGWALSDVGVLWTSDAGAHWSITKIDLPGLTPGSSPFDGQLYFFDSIHGWASLETATYQSARQKWLLVTSDGGRTWKAAGD